jgi:UPF0716 protein FxsA
MGVEPETLLGRWSCMVLRLFLIYVLVELAVVVALASTIGFGWTVLLLLGAFMLGLAMAGPQIKRHIGQLRAGFDNPQRAVTDSVLVALGAVLVAIPGLVSTVLGLLLLLPPTRAAARPAFTLLAARRAPFLTAAAAAASRRRPDYIDGEVIDVVDIEPPALPPHTD